MLGGAQGAGGLRGVLLAVPQVRDRLGEHGQPDDQHQRAERRVAGDVPVGGQQPGGPAQAIPGRGGRGAAPVRCPCRAVVGVGGLAENPAAQRGGGCVQRVRRRPRGVSGGARIVPGEQAADVS